jgi:hypothetical protein
MPAKGRSFWNVRAMPSRLMRSGRRPVIDAPASRI